MYSALVFTLAIYSAVAVRPDWPDEYTRRIIRGAKVVTQETNVDSPEGRELISNISRWASESQDGYFECGGWPDTGHPKGPHCKISKTRASGFRSGCSYPCKLHHGCVCNHSKPYLAPDWQWYGTCERCNPGWGGKDCSLLAVKCQNGGYPVGKFQCRCPPGFTGHDCLQRTCLNKRYFPKSKPIPFDGPLDPTTHRCHCDKGYDGSNCAVCTAPNTTCRSLGGTCTTGLLPQSDSDTNYWCEVTDKPLIELISGGARNVSLYVQVHMNKTDPYGSVPNGTVAFSIFRDSGPYQWMEEWMMCTATECNWHVTNRYYPPRLESPSRWAVMLREGLGYAAVSFLGVFLLLAIPHEMVFQLRKSLLKPLFVVVVVLFVVSVTVGSIIGHGVVSPGYEAQRAVYRCKNSACHCSKLNVSAPVPQCANSLAGPVVNSIKGPLQIDCDLKTSVCSALLAGIGMLPLIVAKCRASSCIPPGAVRRNAIVDPPQATTPSQVAVWGVLASLVAVFMVTVAHYLFALKRRRSRMIAYRALVAADGEESESPTILSLSNGFFAIRQKTFTLRLPSIIGNPANIPNERSTALLANDDLAPQTQSGWRIILRDVNLEVRSGEVLALMGSSGAGKTTLLDILATHSKSGLVKGTISINGESITHSNRHDYKRMTGFVAQEDLLLPSLTVQQSIRHAARLKLPAPVSDSQIEALVVDMIESLQLTDIAESQIGSTTGDGMIRGISGGERRRVSIAMELIANPRILFLDEPTSGLDAVNAFIVMKTITSIARQCRSAEAYRGLFKYRPIVIFSIHQPSAELFRLFDKVMVLSKGSVAYFGPANLAVSHVAEKLELRPGEFDEQNPADVVLRMIHESTRERREILSNCPYPSTVNVSFSNACRSKESETAGSLQIPTNSALNPVLHLAAENHQYYPDSWTQFVTLARRMRDSLMGSYYLVASHAGVTVLLCALLAYLYNNESLTLNGTIDKAGMLMFLLLIVSLSSLSVLDLFIAERSLFAVERENGYYSTLPYFIVKVLFDFIPLRVIPIGILAAATYFPMGLRDDTGAPFSWFVGIIVGFSLFSTSTCLCVGMIAPSFGSGALFCSLLMLWQSLFGGLLVQADTIPTYLRPFKYLSSFRFAFESIMINELQGRDGCTVQPDNGDGVPEGPAVPIRCVQFLFHLGLNPNNFSLSIALLMGGCAAALLCSFGLLAVFVRHTR